MRGLNAPPRRAVAPAALTARAVVSVCSSLSTEHGPAMTPMCRRPPPRPPPARGCPGGAFSRPTSLKGTDPQDSGDPRQAGGFLLAAAGPAQDADALAFHRRQLAAVAVARLELRIHRSVSPSGADLFEFDDQRYVAMLCTYFVHHLC